MSNKISNDIIFAEFTNMIAMVQLGNTSKQVKDYAKKQARHYRINKKIPKKQRRIVDDMFQMIIVAKHPNDVVHETYEQWRESELNRGK